MGVAVGVGVLVGAGVGVSVGVLVGRGVDVGLGVQVGILVRVGVGVMVSVAIGVSLGLGVSVFVGPAVRLRVGVTLLVGGAGGGFITDSVGVAASVDACGLTVPAQAAAATMHSNARRRIGRSNIVLCPPGLLPEPRLKYWAWMSIPARHEASCTENAPKNMTVTITRKSLLILPSCYPVVLSPPE